MLKLFKMKLNVSSIRLIIILSGGNLLGTVEINEGELKMNIVEIIHFSMHVCVCIEICYAFF